MRPDALVSGALLHAHKDCIRYSCAWSSSWSGSHQARPTVVSTCEMWEGCSSQRHARLVQLSLAPRRALRAPRASARRARRAARVLRGRLAARAFPAPQAARARCAPRPLSRGFAERAAGPTGPSAACGACQHGVCCPYSPLYSPLCLVGTKQVLRSGKCHEVFIKRSAGLPGCQQ